MTYKFKEFYIPDRMMDGIERWILYGIKPGNFLTAVIENDLKTACERADDENLRNLPAYVAFFYNSAPAACWGSPERVNEWSKQPLAAPDPNDGSGLTSEGVSDER